MPHVLYLPPKSAGKGAHGNDTTVMLLCPGDARGPPTILPLPPSAAEHQLHVPSAHRPFVPSRRSRLGVQRHKNRKRTRRGNKKEGKQVGRCCSLGLGGRAGSGSQSRHCRGSERPGRPLSITAPTCAPVLILAPLPAGREGRAGGQGSQRRSTLCIPHPQHSRTLTGW